MSKKNLHETHFFPIAAAVALVVSFAFFMTLTSSDMPTGYAAVEFPNKGTYTQIEIHCVNGLVYSFETGNCKTISEWGTFADEYCEAHSNNRAVLFSLRTSC